MTFYIVIHKKCKAYQEDVILCLAQDICGDV